MNIKVMAKKISAKRLSCFADCGDDMQAAKDIARRLAKDNTYNQVLIIEKPDSQDDKPYSVKEIIIKPERRAL